MRYLLTTIALAIAIMGNAEARPKAQKRPRQEVVPEFSAKSYIIADATGLILKEHDMTTIMPIASISKLMVALLVVEQDLDEVLTIPTNRQVQSSIPTKIKSLTRRELLTLALVKSDNLAAQILCDNLPDCVEKMNTKAKELAMLSTNFVEPTGLSEGNISTANDLLKLIIAANENPTISHISSMPKAEISTKWKVIKVNNTNPLTSKYDISISKTGYTKPAGGCLVMIINSAVGQRILILLGSKNAHTRIPDMERLVKDLGNI
jgi:D-alanyl-D-alanine endopeptidase (penicillin-binding protein 7)